MYVLLVFDRLIECNSIYDREEVEEEPRKQSVNNNVVETNAYTNSNRDLLQSAYDMYMKQHPKRRRCART